MTSLLEFQPQCQPWSITSWARSLQLGIIESPKHPGWGLMFYSRRQNIRADSVPGAGKIPCHLGCSKNNESNFPSSSHGLPPLHNHPTLYGVETLAWNSSQRLRLPSTLPLRLGASTRPLIFRLTRPHRPHFGRTNFIGHDRHRDFLKRT